MADVQLIKYSGENYGDKYALKKAVFSIKTAKTYSDLEQALVINHFSQLDVYDGTVAEQFARFKKGYLQRALGQGVRFVETYGLLQTRPFAPAQPGTTVCLEIPNNRPERSETIGEIVRIYCSAKEPDILDAYTLFVDPAEMYQFQADKIGNIKESMAIFLDIIFQYILSIDPWGDKNADHFNSFTIGAILGAKWPDTVIANFGDDKPGIGALLNKLKTTLEKEIKKETKLPNVNSYNVWEWCPRVMPGNAPFPGEMKNAKAKRYKKLGAADTLDKGKLKNLYFEVTKADPNMCAVSVCRCLSYHVQMMIEEQTAQNDSQFPGNLDKKAHEYGKEEDGAADLSACPQKGSGKRDDTKSLYLPIRIPRKELVIIMNSDLYKEIKMAAMVSDSSEAGAYNNYIKSFLEFDANIVKLDTMPYGAFKIGSKERYNIWDLYDFVKTDRMGQADVVVHTGHKSIAFGIREYRPFKYIRLHGLYVNPNVYDNNIEAPTGEAVIAAG